MRSLNNYKITFNNQEIKYVEAHDFDVVGNSIIFSKQKEFSAGFAVGVHNEKILALAGAGIISIELVKVNEK